MFKEFRRRLGMESTEEKQAREAEEQARISEYRQKEEQYAQDLIYWLYVDMQQSQSSLIQELRKESSKISDLPLAREWAARMRFDAQSHTRRLTDELLEVTEEKILSNIGVSPENKAKIKVNGLRMALGYWQERLKQPDLITDEIMLGRQRITQIQGRLDSLIDPK